jgi:hypothetical protein
MPGNGQQAAPADHQRRLRRPAAFADGERIAATGSGSGLGNLDHERGRQSAPDFKPTRNDAYPDLADGKTVRFMRLTWEGGLGQRAEFVEVDLATGNERQSGELVAEAVADTGNTWEVGATYPEIWIRKKPTGKHRVVAEGGYPLLVNNESDVLYSSQFARGLWLVGVDGTNRRQVFNHPGYILMEPRRHSRSKLVLIVDALDSDPVLGCGK